MLASRGLQRTQEVQQILLLLAIQLLETMDHLVSLRTGTGMILDRLEQTAIGGTGPAIMKSFR